MADCKQTLADVGMPSDVGLENVVALLACTSLVPADVGMVDALALVKAGHVITNAYCGTRCGGATGDTPCGTYHC